MRLTKEQVERFKPYALQKMPSGLCDDWLKMWKELEEIDRLVASHVCVDGTITEPECGRCLVCKLKVLLG